MIKLISYCLFHSLFISFILTLCDYYCHTRLNVLYYKDLEHSISLFPLHPTSEIFLNFFGIGIYCTLTGLFIFYNIKPIPLFNIII